VILDKDVEELRHGVGLRHALRGVHLFHELIELRLPRHHARLRLASRLHRTDWWTGRVMLIVLRRASFGMRTLTFFQ